jgi:hypothetical protein
MSAREDHDQRNGEGDGKKPIDRDTLAIFEARRNAFAEPRERLDRAKYMFAELCDRATNSRCPGFIRKGSVAIPDSELARKFGVWESTIYNWKRQLEAAGYVWTSKQYRSDRWPMTVYHLACIHPRPNFDTQNPDGSSNAAPGRSAPPDVKGGRGKGRKRKHPSPPLTPPVTTQTVVASPEMLENQGFVAVTHSFLWASATINCGSGPQQNVAVSHNPMWLSATTECGPQPQPNVAHSHNGNGADSHNGVVRTATTECGLNESQRRLRDEVPPKRLDKRAVSGERKPATPAVKRTPQQRESERLWLASCTEVFGEKETERIGGWLIQVLRENSKKAWACLNEVRAMKKEQRIKVNPPAAFNDLWKKDRLGLDQTNSAAPKAAAAKSAPAPANAPKAEKPKLTPEERQRLREQQLRQLKEAIR